MARPSNNDSQEKVSLEELLRFKRAERPDDAFWNRFDGELHQRMMQALVKKDPWPVQVLRGLSGKLAQTTAIGAVAAVLALMVVRTAFIATSDSHSLHVAQLTAGSSAAAPVENFSANNSDKTAEVDSAMLAEADYGIEVYSVDAVDSGLMGVTREFGLDRIEVANYDIAVYSADSALPGFTSTGMASLVY